MRRFFAKVGASLLLLPLIVSPAVAADAADPPPTPQQAYDQANADFKKNDWAAAIRGFAALVEPASDRPMSRSQANIHAMLARAYAAHHEIDNAQREAGLARKGLTPEDDVQLGLVWLAIGDAHWLELANVEATDAYEMAVAAAERAKHPILIARARIDLASSLMTVQPDRAAALLDAVLAAPEVTSASPIWQAQINDLRGRASLNAGQAKEARSFLDKAIKLSGGVGGTKVNLAQVGIRADAAIDAVLTGRNEDAAKYLTYTGAGHLPSEEWNTGLGDPPVCGDASGVTPLDTAVVEFSIGEDGRVTDANPVYSSRPGTVGVSFARAVSHWKWNPERITALPPFWRRMVRIEMRCLSRPNPEKLGAPFLQQTIEWLSHMNVAREDLAPLIDGYIPRDDPRLQSEDLHAIPALFARLAIETDQKRSDAIAQRLWAALERTNAPAVPRAVALTMKRGTPGFHSWSSEQVRVKAANLELLERTDPRTAAVAWLALEYAIALETNGRFKDAVPVLDRVLAFPPDVLGEHDPVRDVAVLHLAALKRRAGDVVAADAQVNAAGLTRAQCMLFDVRPVATSQGTSASDFPDDARRWGFDGFVREAFDINAAGQVENVRAIIAYPPFIFRSSADHAVSRFKYLAPVVDGGAAGCEGHTQNVSYRFAR